MSDDGDRILGSHNQVEDTRADQSLRPKTLQDFIGQKELKEKLRIFLGAAKKRGEALDHTLFSGPPGLGKTSLAQVIARELGVQIVATSGPALEKAGDLAAILTNLNSGDVLFIDEIHRLSRLVEESLYPALEDYHLDIVLGEGPSARIMKINLPKFTLIGATTRAGLLTSPLMARFGMSFRLNYYEPEDLQTIVVRSAAILGCRIELDGALEISQRARGTPRIANRLLRRVRDYAEMKADGIITQRVSQAALEMMGVDSQGLDSDDREFLKTIIEKFGGGPVGIDTLSSALSEERETLEDVYEPFLIQTGYVNRTNRGRVATERAYGHLGLPKPNRTSDSSAGSSPDSSKASQLTIF